MNPLDGFVNWIKTEAACPTFSVTTLGSVINGLPLNVPPELVMVTPGVRFVNTALTGPAMADALVFVTVMVADQMPVARLRPNPFCVTLTCGETLVTIATAALATDALGADESSARSSFCK